MTELDGELIETLLRNEESTVLEHKREQYLSAKADAPKDAKLLETILAMANAWRPSDAYIVIGVAENKGGRATVHGITDVIDDGRVQQFVNEKTNTPVNFRYENVPIDGKRCAVITIAKEQKRPIWLKKAFAGLREEVVYIRRGSINAKANPDEIADMGAARAGRGENATLLEVGVGEPDTDANAELLYSVISSVLKPEPELPLAAQAVQDMIHRVRFVDPSEPREEDVLAYRRARALLAPIAFQVRNVGRRKVSDVRLEVRVPKLRGLRLCDAAGLPSKPSRGTYIRTEIFTPSDVFISERDDHWIVDVRIGKVQVGATSWSDALYIGAETPLLVPLQMRITGDELSVPHSEALEINVTTTSVTWSEWESKNG